MFIILFLLSFIFSNNYLPKQKSLNNLNNLNQITKNFDIPQGLESAVGFWVDVYSKYDTNQIIIHDTKYFVVYEVVDVSDIKQINYFTDIVKQEIIDSRIVRIKKKYKDALIKIARNNEDISNSDVFLYELMTKFKGIKEKNLFYNLAREARIREQKGLKSSFKKAIYYSSRYLPMMEKVFEEKGLPTELTRLPYVESFFSPHAESYKSASGIWQFIKGTAKPYLNMHDHYDERRDPIISTQAAAKLLKKNYQHLKDWPLAITAYNHGLYGMKRAVKQSKTKDLVKIIKKFENKSFGFASKNFYAEFLAALFVDKNKESLFEDLVFAKPHNTALVVTMKHLNISQLENLLDIDRDLIRYYNPAIAKKFYYNYELNLPKGSKIRIPYSNYKKMMARTESVKRLKNYVRVI